MDSGAWRLWRGVLTGFVLVACWSGSAMPIEIAQAKQLGVTLTWLRVAPTRPATLYVGGYQSSVGTCVASPAEYTQCPLWAADSVDGGSKWHSLVNNLAAVDSSYAIIGTAARCAAIREPFRLAPDGRNVYVLERFVCSASQNFSYLLRSTDEGTHWFAVPDIAAQPNVCEPFLTDGLSISQVNPQLLYATVTVTNCGYAIYMVRSTDAGAHWQYTITDPNFRIDGMPLALTTVYNTVIDPVSPRTVYLGLAPTWLYAAGPVLWARSEDGGVTWHFVARPIAQPFNLRSHPPTIPYTSFTLSTDPHLPKLIVAQLTGKGVPADRRYVSADHGRTWKAVRCPGDLHGACPAATLDNVFGAGHSYGLYQDGVHAFSGAGPAGPRLALSKQLPCQTSALIDVAGGNRAGQPVYLLCQDPAVPLATPPTGVTWTLDQNPNLRGILYRSVDGGKSWQRLNPAGAR